MRVNLVLLIYFDIELKKTVIRAIESRQINLEKKNGYSVYTLQEKMNELLEKGKVNVGVDRLVLRLTLLGIFIWLGYKLLTYSINIKRA